MRAAVFTFEADHGFLPGTARDPSSIRAPSEENLNPSAQLVTAQLCGPVDDLGQPVTQNGWPGPLASLPLNPFTGSSSVVIVPPNTDPVSFAATVSDRGWAYATTTTQDANGPLPPGLVLPCGSGVRHLPADMGVQDIGFATGDLYRWR